MFKYFDLKFYICVGKVFSSAAKSELDNAFSVFCDEKKNSLFGLLSISAVGISDWQMTVWRRSQSELQWRRNGNVPCARLTSSHLRNWKIISVHPQNRAKTSQNQRVGEKGGP